MPASPRTTIARPWRLVVQRSSAARIIASSGRRPTNGATRAARHCHECSDQAVTGSTCSASAARALRDDAITQALAEFLGEQHFPILRLRRERCAHAWPASQGKQFGAAEHLSLRDADAQR